jgi:ABC-type polysaccharide/polyol phosphate transport system ATPase subunit
MYMRLAFAVATEVDPDILLIDEILAVGDVAFQEKCKERIQAFRARGKTILLVSHNMDMIRGFCDRTMLMNAGELVADGPSESVVARYQEIATHHQQPVLAG